MVNLNRARPITQAEFDEAIGVLAAMSAEDMSEMLRKTHDLFKAQNAARKLTLQLKGVKR